MGRKARPKGNAKRAAKKEKEKEESSVWDESAQPYPHFKLNLKPNKFAASHKQLMKDILALILEQVENEMKALPHKERKPTKVKGKHYTPLGGAFLVELLSADEDTEMEPVILLFGLRDLYLQGFNVAAVWFMLQGADVPIPPSSQISYGRVGRSKGKDPFKDGKIRLPWTGNYNDLGEGKYQKFHYTAFQKAYKKLRQAPEHFLGNKGDVLRTPMGFFAVGISECVRYDEIAEWVVLHSTNPLIFIGVMLPPEKITDIGEWGTNSEKCYGDDPPKRVRVVKRHSDEHSLMRCETVYKKEKGIANKKEDGKGKGEVKEVAAEAEMEELDKEETEDEQSTLEEQEVDQKNEENDDEEDAVLNDEEVDQKKDEENDDEEDAVLGDEEFAEISSMAFSADGHLAAFISGDGKVKIRETNTQTLLGTLQGDIEVKWVNWLSDGSLIIGGSASHEAWVWSVEHNAMIRKLPSKVTCGDFSANGDYLCTGSDDGLLRIWSPNLECQRVVAVGSEVTCLVITADSQFVISGSEDGSILVIDMESGLAIGSLVGHMGSSSVTCLGMSPSSSKIMASGSSDGKVVIWDVVAQKAICVCWHEAAVRSLTWLGRTKYVASACEDGKVHVWDSVTGLLAATSTKFMRISKLMMSPCGKELVVFTAGPAWALDVSMFE